MRNSGDTEQMSRVAFLNQYSPIGPIRTIVAAYRGEIPPNSAVKGVVRQAGFILALLGLSGCAPENTNHPQAAEAPQVAISAPIYNNETTDVSNTEPLIAKGFALRSTEDTDMLNNTKPGIDLAIFEHSKSPPENDYNPTPKESNAVTAIRAITNPMERIMAAIGFLDVKHSGRYDYDKYQTYACNIYAVDLTELLLGDDAIGSSYSAIKGESGRPDGLSWNFLATLTSAEYDNYTNNHPAISSNNLAYWMDTYGTKKYGWTHIDNQKQLENALKAGAIGIGVSSQDYLNKQETGYIGHALTVFDTGSGFGVSQSTNNFGLLKFGYNSTYEKVNPGNPEHKYDFYVHQLPPPIK